MEGEEGKCSAIQEVLDIENNVGNEKYARGKRSTKRERQQLQMNVSTSLSLSPPPKHLRAPIVPQLPLRTFKEPGILQLVVALAHRLFVASIYIHLT